MNIFQKIIYSLSGFLIGTLVMATMLKITGAYWGTFIGMIFDGAAAWYLLNKFSKQKNNKFIAWGIIASIILITVAGLIILASASALMQGVSN